MLYINNVGKGTRKMRIKSDNLRNFGHSRPKCARIVSDYSVLPSFSFCLLSVEGSCSKTSKILVSLRLFNS